MQKLDPLPLSHKVYPMTKELHRKITIRFMKPDAFQVNGITVNLIDDAENYLLLVEFFSVLQQRTYSKNYSMMVRLISYNTITFWRQHVHFTKKVWDMLLKGWVWLTCFGVMQFGWISLAERHLNGLTSNTLFQGLKASFNSIIKK